MISQWVGITCGRGSGAGDSWAAKTLKVIIQSFNKHTVKDAALDAGGTSDQHERQSRLGT